eukprot:CAMPEP_0119568760 /NCGR_PEP_ID=MMETSP1352-20130426/39728_1 /TAXON_ID=265584 /ORGANISM="Stauroneis constricta, Strain CCMP1120" /LENGTH=59 /DNA_ID=CAMNT_0007618209 /DNA_START=41 /DNA_END=217 /DNA_ORIENTATION=+
MMDPMANLDAGATPGQTEEEKEVIDFSTLRLNLQRIDKTKSVMGIAAGCVAGIMGLTGW